MTVCIIGSFSSAARAEAVYSKTTKFRIPFQFDQAELERLGATEIQLHVSDTQGTSWNLHESVDPDAGRFTFQAKNDGEYWFAVRTIAAGGLSYPAGPPEAGLKVIVDTASPRLQLRVEELQAGRVQLNWEAFDSHLNPDSLVLEFRDPGTSDWKPVVVQPAAHGQTSWTVNKAGLVEARATVEDIAGNSAHIATQTIVTGAAPASPASSSERARPIAQQSSGDSILVANSPISTSGAKTDHSRRPSPDDTPGSFDLILPNVTMDEPSQPAPVVPASRSTEMPAAINNAQVNASPPQDPDAPEVPQRLVPTSQSDLQGNSIPPVASQAIDAAHLLNTERPPLRNGQLVNSTKFRIGYQIEDIGPSGVGSVELYISENNGQKWFHYGTDHDRESPIDVEVPKDGQFGFSFRIRNGVGRMGTPPQPGEKPEIIITVDRDAPVANLLPVQQGEGLRHDQILIKWTAQDRQLDANPVALYHSRNPQGPWELINGWQPNTGQYLWTVPPTIDHSFYIRLEVRDAAGNITSINSAMPSAIDRSQPKARITEIESLRPGSLR